MGSSTVVVHLSNANTGWLDPTEQRVERKENGKLIWISGMDMDHESEATQSFWNVHPPLDHRETG